MLGPSDNLSIKTPWSTHWYPPIVPLAVYFKVRIFSDNTWVTPTHKRSIWLCIDALKANKSLCGCCSGPGLWVWVLWLDLTGLWPPWLKPELTWPVFFEKFLFFFKFILVFRWNENGRSTPNECLWWKQRSKSFLQGSSRLLCKIAIAWCSVCTHIRGNL